MIFYKIDIIKALKDKGFSTYCIRKNKIFGEATMQKFRTGEIVTIDCIDKLCSLLDCQPSDIIGYKKDE